MLLINIEYMENVNFEIEFKNFADDCTLVMKPFNYRQHEIYVC